MATNDLGDIRREYSAKRLTRQSVAAEPLKQFEKWMDEALNSRIIDATAMTVSTVGEDGRPSSRVVLLKGYSTAGFIFYTNYDSKKGRDLAANPQVALHFYWPDLERQVMVGGTASKTSREESAAYFAQRPRESQIGAWASRQSSELRDRFELEARIVEARKQFEGGDVPCPPNWGGYRVVPDAVEFWQGRESRLHDRICYTLDDGQWTISRLSP